MTVAKITSMILEQELRDSEYIFDVGLATSIIFTLGSDQAEVNSKLSAHMASYLYSTVLSGFNRQNYKIGYRQITNKHTPVFIELLPQLKIQIIIK